jgi:hypothetical protein
MQLQRFCQRKNMTTAFLSLLFSFNISETEISSIAFSKKVFIPQIYGAQLLGLLDEKFSRYACLRWMNTQKR